MSLNDDEAELYQTNYLFAILDEKDAEIERLRKLCAKSANVMQTMDSTWDEDELSLWEELNNASREE